MITSSGPGRFSGSRLCGLGSARFFGPLTSLAFNQVEVSVAPPQKHGQAVRLSVSKHQIFGLVLARPVHLQDRFFERHRLAAVTLVIDTVNPAALYPLRLLR